MNFHLIFPLLGLCKIVTALTITTKRSLGVHHLSHYYRKDGSHNLTSCVDLCLYNDFVCVKSTVMQSEKVLINVRLRVSKVFQYFKISHSNYL